MAIEFRCGSIVSFDQETKKYVTCNEQIRVDKNQSGSLIVCPKCKNSIEVPYAAPEGAPEPVSGPARTEIELAPLDESVEGGSESSRETAEYRKRNSIGEQSAFGNSAVAGSAMQAETQLGHTRFTSSNTCLKCGANLHKAIDVCPTCGKPVPAFVNRTERTLESKHKLTGFQLWLANIFSSEETQRPAAAIPLLHTIAGCAVAGSCLVLIVFGGCFGFLIAVPLMVVTAMYVFAVFKWNQMKKDHFTRPNFWQLWLWNGLLQVNRFLNWKNPFDSEQRYRVLDMRFSEISDADLYKLDGIGHSEVIDLQGQPISDQGLLFLHDRKQLRRIVLRKTHVTLEGVFHLQQAIPRAWIWSE